MANEAFDEIVSEISRFASAATDFTSLQEFTVARIRDQLAYYNWVGFYMLDPDNERVLVLGPYRGAPTEHIRIPVSEGICGAAVEEGEAVIIGDVSEDPRYLACSIETRSEIVVPIRARGKIVGEIDVDSHTLNAFNADDRKFLESSAEVLGKFLERQST